MSIKVLIVEDSVLHANNLQEALEDQNCTVAGRCKNKSKTIQTLEKLKMSNSLPDIVLIDINLADSKDIEEVHKAGESGITVAELINATYNIPIIYTTGYHDCNDEFIKEAFKTEPRAYLVKPIKIETLLPTIHLALHAHKLKKNIKREYEFKTQFLRKIAEAIRTRFNVIFGHIQILEESIIGNENYNIMTIEFDALTRLLENLEEYVECLNNTIPYKLENIEISTIISNVLQNNELVNLIKRNDSKIDVDIESMKNKEIHVNKKHSTIILDQVIHNAIKFNPKMNISITGYTTTDGNVAIMIKDTGKGIPKQILQSIFSIFKNDNSTENLVYSKTLGIGLPLTKALCNLNNINIEIFSHKNNGTTVTLVFPTIKS